MKPLVDCTRQKQGPLKNPQKAQHPQPAFLPPSWAQGPVLAGDIREPPHRARPGHPAASRSQAPSPGPSHLLLLGLQSPAPDSGPGPPPALRGPCSMLSFLQSPPDPHSTRLPAGGAPSCFRPLHSTFPTHPRRQIPLSFVGSSPQSSMCVLLVTDILPELRTVPSP